MTNFFQAPKFEPLDLNARGPLNMPGVTMPNPWADLGKISGAEDADPSIRALGEQAIQVQERAASVSIIIPNQVIDQIDRGYMLRMAELAAPRVGGNGGIFALDEAGSRLYQSTVPGLRQIGLEAVGSSCDQIHDGMGEYRDRLDALAMVHRSHLPSLIELQEGGLLVEMGAGRDTDRILALSDVALGKRARLVCHDVAPDAARWASKDEHLASKGIPYLAIPPRHEFLGDCLKGKRPIAITMKNVLSGMSLGAINHLVETASDIGAQRLLVFQSVGISDKTNFLPNQFGPQGLEWNHAFSQHVPDINYKLSLTSSSPSAELGVAIVEMQAAITYRLLVMALAQRNLADIAAERGVFKFSNAYSVSVHRDLEPDKAMSYLNARYPEFIAGFGTLFNSITLGPFTAQFRLEAGVSSGCLRLQSIETVLELSKDQQARTPRLATPNTRVFEAQGAAKILTEPVHRWISPEQLVLFLRDRGDPDIAYTALNGINYRAAQIYGAKFALNLALNFFGKKLQIPQFQRYSSDQAAYPYWKAFGEW